jgi:hypothetical protein
MPQLAMRPSAPRIEPRAKASSPATPPNWLSTVFGPFGDTFSSEKARAKLGWSPRLDLRSSQELTVTWLRDALGMD